MKVKLSTVKITTLATGLVAAILLLMPFHAFLTIWLSGLIGHYTALRLWKEVLLLVIVACAKYLLWQDRALLKTFLASKLNRLIVGYYSVLIIWGIAGYLLHHVTLKALGYGFIVDGRFLLFFLAVSVIASSSPRLLATWPKLMLWPAAVVMLFGLLQYFVLPHDVLRHVGYNESTIYPYETINHNAHYIRVMSTLRGANPLGAYLVIVLSLLAALWSKLRTRGTVVIGIVGVVVLGLTFSRSAWLGAILAAATLLWAGLQSRRSRQVALGGVAGLLIIAGITSLILHHNTAFQNAVFHTDDKSKIAISSNEGHASALKSGLRDVMHAPLGEGVGTAGPASVYNHAKVRIAENFFVQIAQETGLVGVLLFITVQLLVGRQLWRKRADPLALGLLAGLIGVSFVNLLSHAWADDTLAYLFWGLAGIALARPQAQTQSKKVKAAEL